MALPPVRVAISCNMALRRSPKPGRLNGCDLQRSTQLVDDQRGQRFAFNVLRYDQQRLAALGDLLEQREAGPSSN